MSYLTPLIDTDTYLLSLLPLSTLFSVSLTSKSLNALVNTTSSYQSYLDTQHQPIHQNKWYYCVSHGYLCVLEYLVSLGVDTRYNNEYALMYYASANGHLNVTKYLVSLGAHARAYTDWALHNAMSNCHLSVIEYLVSLGCDIRNCSEQSIRSGLSKGGDKLRMYLISLGITC